jgi:hypothetical protein
VEEVGCDLVVVVVAVARGVAKCRSVGDERAEEGRREQLVVEEVAEAETFASLLQQMMFVEVAGGRVLLLLQVAEAVLADGAKFEPFVVVAEE